MEVAELKLLIADKTDDAEVLIYDWDRDEFCDAKAVVSPKDTRTGQDDLKRVGTDLVLAIL